MNPARILLALAFAAGPVSAQMRMLPEGALRPRTPADKLAVIDHRSIPKHLWGREIAALKPIRVYRHRVNVAVVLHEDKREERGIYFQVWISSYLPVNGPGMRYHWNEKSKYLEYVFTK